MVAKSGRVQMKLRGLLVVGWVVVTAGGIAPSSRAEPEAQKEAAEARRSLRQQGFKTELSDFDFSTDYPTSVRAEALTTIRYTRPLVLLQACGTECAIVAWKQAGLEEEEGYQNLPSVGQVLVTNRLEFDSARAAFGSGRRSEDCAPCLRGAALPLRA